MRLTPSQAQQAFIPLMVLAMSGVMSLVITAVQPSISSDLLTGWLHQWAVSFCVGLPTAQLLAPLIRGGLARVTAPSSSHARAPRREAIGACHDGSAKREPSCL